jgi:hypothetical protein
MLRILSYCYLACGTTALILVPHVRRTKAKVDVLKPTTALECFKDKTIYILLIITLLAATYGIYMLSAFKIFGMMTL